MSGRRTMQFFSAVCSNLAPFFTMRYSNRATTVSLSIATCPDSPTRTCTIDVNSKNVLGANRKNFQFTIWCSVAPEICPILLSDNMDEFYLPSFTFNCHHLSEKWYLKKKWLGVFCKFYYFILVEKYLEKWMCIVYCVNIKVGREIKKILK